MNYSIDDLIKLVGLKEIEILSLRQEIEVLRRKVEELIKKKDSDKKK